MAKIEELIVPVNRPKIRMKLEKGDDIVEELEKIAIYYDNYYDPNVAHNGFGFAEFRMLGAVSHVNYQISEINKDADVKKPPINREQNAELLFCYGTIGWDSQNPNIPKVHGHIVFADNDSCLTPPVIDQEGKITTPATWRNGNEKYVAFGGHLNKGTKISITAEIIIEILSSRKILRENDTRLDKEGKMPYGSTNLWKDFGTYPALFSRIKRS